jgi:hypothetical protein
MIVGEYEDPAPTEKPEDPAVVKIGGISFELREKPAVMSLLQYFKAAIDGSSTQTIEGQAQTINFFEGVFEPSEFARFSQHCRRANISYAMLVDIVGDIFGYYMDRPTTSLSDSSTSDGDADTSTEGDSSAAAPSSKPKKVRRVA